MPWFQFRQNNSGGSFVGPTYVLIEAATPEEANHRAESKTEIYFDDDYDIDCPCCGQRWYRVSYYEKGTEVPSIYDMPVESYVPSNLSTWHDNDILIVPLEGDTTLIEHKSV